jgi:hypothetical protein
MVGGGLLHGERGLAAVLDTDIKGGQSIDLARVKNFVNGYMGQDLKQ